MHLFIANVVLAVCWALVTGSFTLLNLVFGFLVGLLALVLIGDLVGPVTWVRRVRLGLALAVLFLKELVKSAWRVALVVLSPKLDLKPGIIAVPLTVTDDFEITLLANLVTLTPGTLSVDVSEDRRTLYVHCLDVPDAEATIADIRDGFERTIMETFR